MVFAEFYLSSDFGFYCCLLHEEKTIKVGFFKAKEDTEKQSNFQEDNQLPSSLQKENIKKHGKTKKTKQHRESA